MINWISIKYLLKTHFVFLYYCRNNQYTDRCHLHMCYCQVGKHSGSHTFHRLLFLKKIIIMIFLSSWWIFYRSFTTYGTCCQGMPCLGMCGTEIWVKQFVAKNTYKTIWRIDDVKQRKCRVVFKPQSKIPI